MKKDPTKVGTLTPDAHLEPQSAANAGYIAVIDLIAALPYKRLQLMAR